MSTQSLEISAGYPETQTSASYPRELFDQENATFTTGYIFGRTPHGHDGFYDVSYFTGAKRDAGIQFPENGAFLDPESEYRFKFQDILSWLEKYAKEGTVLDVGTGPGHLAYWAQKKGMPFRIIGSDISLPLLRSSFNQNSAASVNSNAYELPFAGEQFQAVVFSDVLEHIWPRQAVQAIKEAHRLLNNNGYVFVNIPNRITWNRAAQRDQGHVWLPSLNEVAKMITLGGFGSEEVKMFTRGFPGSNIFRIITGQDLKGSLLGRSIFACARK